MNKPAMARKVGAYQDVGVVGSVEDADPQRLILLIMDGALESMSRAQGHLERGEIPAKALALSRAVSLVDALRAFLDHEAGGEMAASLESLYDYLARRLTEANAGNRGDLISEASALLRDIRDAWARVPEALMNQQALAGV